MNQLTLKRDWQDGDRNMDVTLRDQFAMAALTGILSDPDAKIGQQVAEYAYKMADLMLVERAKK